MKRNRVRIGRNRRITVPADFLKKLRLRRGAQFVVTVSDDCISLMPMARIPKDQLWYCNPEWQAMECQADEDIKAGRVTSFASADELIDDLEQARKASCGLGCLRGKTHSS